VSGALPIVLFFVLAGFAALVGKAVKNRHDFVKADPGLAEILPDLTTDQRLTVVIRRLWVDSEQGLPLIEAGFGKHRFVFCPTDHASKTDIYKTTVGKSATIALFGLATLHPEPMQTIGEQLAFEHTGQFANDYVVNGELHGVRDHDWNGTALAVYRTKVMNAADLTLLIELGVPNELASALVGKSWTHGNVRLFGYLAD
jgi:hypothetical protein